MVDATMPVLRREAHGRALQTGVTQGRNEPDWRATQLEARGKKSGWNLISKCVLVVNKYQYDYYDD
eukprot:12196106-Heterocapsa_arctica.AAC.1